MVNWYMRGNKVTYDNEKATIGGYATAGDKLYLLWINFKDNVEMTVLGKQLKKVKRVKK